MNLLYGLVRHVYMSFVLKWLEHPTGVRKVVGSNPVRGIFLCPTLVTW